MKEKKYAQLLSNVSAIKTTLEFNNTQLTEFSKKVPLYCEDLKNNLLKIQTNLENNFTSQFLAQATKDILKIKKDFKKTIEAPTLDYKKTIDKVEKTIREKINPVLIKESSTVTFDLNIITTALQQIKPLISDMQKNIDSCLTEISNAHLKIAKTENLIQKLDLPNIISKATKQLEILNEELLNPDSCTTNLIINKEYKDNVLPLYSALTKLKIRSEEVLEKRSEEREEKVKLTP